jgi:hypothetical protein
MKFLIAKRELARLAKGEYYTLSYSLNCFGNKPSELRQTCSVYVQGFGQHQANTWSKALGALRAHINGSSHVFDKNETPCEEVKDAISH